MNLYELSTRYQQLLDQDDYTEDELKELESLHSSIEDECIERSKYIKNMQALRSSIELSIIDMNNRIDTLSHKITKQESKLCEKMILCNITKINKSPLFQIKIKHNPSKVDIYDKSMLPSQYTELFSPPLVEKISKTSIKEAIDKGIDVPGARLVSSVRVEIK